MGGSIFVGWAQQKGLASWASSSQPKQGLENHKQAQKGWGLTPGNLGLGLVSMLAPVGATPPVQQHRPGLHPPGHGRAGRLAAEVSQGEADHEEWGPGRGTCLGAPGVIHRGRPGHGGGSDTPGGGMGGFTEWLCGAIVCRGNNFGEANLAPRQAQREANALRGPIG